MIDPVVRFLADYGANVNQRDNYGLTPLHYACMRGNFLKGARYAPAPLRFFWGNLNNYFKKGEKRVRKTMEKGTI